MEGITTVVLSFFDLTYFQAKSEKEKRVRGDLIGDVLRLSHFRLLPHFVLHARLRKKAHCHNTKKILQQVLLPIDPLEMYSKDQGSSLFEGQK